MQGSMYVKSLTIGIIVLVIGTFATPAMGIYDYINTKSYKDHYLHKNIIDEDFVVEKNFFPISDWKQVIGDFPNGDMDNGFNNSANVAIRGKTIFTVDDKEYLFFGTGSVNNSPGYSFYLQPHGRRRDRTSHRAGSPQRNRNGRHESLCGGKAWKLRISDQSKSELPPGGHPLGHEQPQY